MVVCGKGAVSAFRSSLLSSPFVHHQRKARAARGGRRLSCTRVAALRSNGIDVVARYVVVIKTESELRSLLPQYC